MTWEGSTGKFAGTVFWIQPLHLKKDKSLKKYHICEKSMITVATLDFTMTNLSGTSILIDIAIIVLLVDSCKCMTCSLPMSSDWCTEIRGCGPLK